MAHELASTRADDHARAQIALTLATALNRLGEFRDALALARSAAKEFEMGGEMQTAAQCLFQAAWAQTFLGHLKDALADAERTRQMDTSDLMNARCDWIQARVSRDQGRYPEAGTLFEKSRAVFESNDMPLEAARCTRERAHACLLGERTATISHLQSARQTIESAQCIFDVAFCDFLSGVDLLLKTCYPEAQKLISQARDKFLHLGAEFFVGWSDAQMGIIHRFQNRFEESLECSHRARDYFLSHDVPVEVSACDINLGITYHALNRYDEALTCYQEAADIALKEGHEARAGRIFNNMGETYGLQGLYAKALDLHQRALEIYGEKGLTSLMGSALVNLAIACRQLGQYDQAIGHLQRAREIFLTKNFAIRLAECEFNLGDVYFALHEASAAHIHLQRAREIYTERKLESLVAACDRLLAYLAGENGERGRARSLIVASRATFLNHHQIVDAALCDLAEGELAHEWQANEPAKEALLRAHTILSPGFPDFAWRIAYGLGRCAWAAGDRTAALDHYLDAVHTIARSRSVLVTEQLSNDYFA
ncbi:MAG: tetratricopeptide repeat protein [Chloroflexi bacterium]|nr:tetratricopeptide repeat protein [Chloroflexota bacterium]